MPGRRRRHVENSEYVEFVGRIMKAMGKRVGAGDVAALSELVGLKGQIDEAIERSVAQLRSEPWMYSWAQIGEVIGITRQAAQKRYGHVEVIGGRTIGGQPAALR